MLSYLIILTLITTNIDRTPSTPHWIKDVASDTNSQRCLTANTSLLMSLRNMFSQLFSTHCSVSDQNQEQSFLIGLSMTHFLLWNHHILIQKYQLFNTRADLDSLSFNRQRWSSGKLPSAMTHVTFEKNFLHVMSYILCGRTSLSREKKAGSVSWGPLISSQGGEKDLFS